MCRSRLGTGARSKHGLAVIVIGHIMTVTMKSPEQILFEPMRVAMVCDHVGMFGHDIKDRGDVAGTWCKRPQQKREAENCRK